jgi:hypothetical protein
VTGLALLQEHCKISLWILQILNKASIPFKNISDSFSVNSYLYLKPAKMLCLSYYLLCFLFYKIGEEGRTGSAWKWWGWGWEGWARGQKGEMAQIMYAHMNKWINNKKIVIPNILFIALLLLIFLLLVLQCKLLMEGQIRKKQYFKYSTKCILTSHSKPRKNGFSKVSKICLWLYTYVRFSLCILKFKEKKKNQKRITSKYSTLDRNLY